MGEQARHELANVLAVLAARAGLRRGAQAPADAEGGLVLLVEDEPVLRELVQEGLRQRGWTALVAEHAEDALGLAAEHGRRVDAVVTDVVMPRMSGRALVERLRRTIPCLRVVFISGHAPTSDLVEAEGVRSAYLQKPFTLDELDGTLRSLISSS